MAELGNIVEDLGFSAHQGCLIRELKGQVLKFKALLCVLLFDI